MVKMEKKRCFNLFLVSFLFISVFLLGITTFGSLIDASDVDDYSQDIDEKAEDIEKKVSEGEERTEEYKKKIEGGSGKWDYLGEEWKKIFLDNKVVRNVDSFLSKISMAFFVLFGKKYSLSVGFFFIFFLWLFFFFRLGKFFSSAGIMEKTPSYLSGLIVSVIFGHIGIYGFISNFFRWLFFVEKGWVWDLFVIIVLVVLAFLFFYFEKIFSGYLKKRKEAKAKQEEDLQRKSLKEFTKQLFRRS